MTILFWIFMAMLGKATLTGAGHTTQMTTVVIVKEC